MAYRVAIIGQSNAILAHGFVNQLAARPGVTIGNSARLGASPSAIIPYFGDRAFFEGHDFAIFDTAIVDQNFLWSEAVDPWSIAHWLEHGVIAAHAAGCMPILLVIPHASMLPTAGAAIVPPLLQQLYRSVAQRNGAACFDLFDAAARRVLRDPQNQAMLYTDPDHLTEQFVGEVVGCLMRFFDRYRTAPIARRRIVKPVGRFETISLLHAEGAHMTELSSSLLTDDFATLSDGQSLRLPVGATTRIVAAMIDRAGSEGVLQLSGSRTIAKQVGTPLDATHRFVAQVVPFLTETWDTNGSVALTAAAPDTPPSEPSWQPRKSARSTIRIARLLVERAVEQMEIEEPLLPPQLRTTDWFTLT